MSIRSVRAIVFDFHGTLAYKEMSVSNMDVVEVLRTVGHDIGPQEWEAAYRYVFFLDLPREGCSDWKEYRSMVFDRLDIEFTPELSEALDSLHKQRNIWRLFPEVAEVLTTLSENFGLGMATTIPSFQVVPILGHLATRFQFIGTGDTVSGAKGSRLFYLTIAEKLDSRPDEILFVGDDPLLDIDIPHSLGFLTAHLTRKNEPLSEVADFHVTSIRDIEPILRAEEDSR